jgi:hypothetical protein
LTIKLTAFLLSPKSSKKSCLLTVRIPISDVVIGEKPIAERKKDLSCKHLLTNFHPYPLPLLGQNHSSAVESKLFSEE